MNLKMIWQRIAGPRCMDIPVAIPVETRSDGPYTATDRYWSDHTVNSKPFKSAKKSLDYLEWRFEQYPLYREFMDLYGSHDNEVVVDYGCGPGNDLVGFSLYAKAKKVIGIDVSEKALRLAAGRLCLHSVDANRVRLIHVTD